MFMVMCRQWDVLVMLYLYVYGYVQTVGCPRHVVSVSLWLCADSGMSSSCCIFMLMVMCRQWDVLVMVYLYVHGYVQTVGCPRHVVSLCLWLCADSGMSSSCCIFMLMVMFRHLDVIFI
jgi:hypothetical protein